MLHPNKIMFLDLETQSHPYYGHLSSPNHPDNYVVAVGWATEASPYKGEIEYSYYASKDQATNWLHIPDDVWLLVAHNASFEINWMWQQHREELTKFLARGGRIFCTQLGYYRLQRQQERFPSLDEVAIHYGGTPKVDAVRLLWEQGHLTSEIDPELLIDYLAGAEGDIANTRIAFYGEYAELVERGMWDAVLAQMDGLVFAALCESNGMYIDPEISHRNKGKLEEQIKVLEDQFYQMLADKGYHQEVQEQFKMTSRFHMSALLYGGVFNADSKELSIDAKGRQRYVKTDAFKCVDTGRFVHVTREFAESNPYPVGVKQQLGVHPVVYKSGKNKGLVKYERVDTDEPLLRNCKQLHTLEGLVPWDVYPKGFETEFKRNAEGAQTLADDSPVYSTDEGNLELIKYHPSTPKEVSEFITMYLQWVGYNKILGTYFLKTTVNAQGRERVTGMMQYITPNNIWHHSLNMTSTTTGRLSGNAQQFPRDESAGVKEMYTSRFGEDGVVCEIDYSALEVIVQACYSRDDNLIRTIIEGTDMHSYRAAPTMGMTYEEFRSIYLDDTHERHKEIADARQNIKPRAFAYQYGATPAGIAFATGCTLQEAEDFVESERKLFPQVEEFFDGVADFILGNTTTGREQTDDGKFRVVKYGMWKAPCGIEFSFRQYPKTIYGAGQPVEVMEFKPTQMRNYPIQGMSSFFVQVVTGYVMRYLVRNNFFDGEVVLTNTVHDAITLDLHKRHIHTVIPKVVEIMESLPRIMKGLGEDLILEFPVEATVGKNLQDQVKLEDYVH